MYNNLDVVKIEFTTFAHNQACCGEEQHFVDEKSTRLFESFTATPHIRLALRPTDGHAFICRRVLRSQQCQVPGTAEDYSARPVTNGWELGSGHCDPAYGPST